MALPWRTIIPKRTCLPVCGLIRHFARLHVPSTRKSKLEPWYQYLVKNARTEEDLKAERSSILRNPGVPAIAKLSKEELCQLLAQNVIYREGPLVAINKPSGLPISGGEDVQISLMSLLPDFQQLLQIKPELHIVKTAPKECSGLVLLSTCHETTKRFEDFYSETRKEKKPFMTFCAVTLGVPEPAEGDVKVALKEEVINDLRLVVPVKDPSKGSVERKEVKLTHTLYKVLDSAEGCSLLQLQPMAAFRDQLLVQCTLKFCPVLGDHTYSSRVAKTFGHNIYIPVDVALPQTQRVEEKLLRKMHFTPQRMHLMPLHLHLHQLLMPTDPQGRYPNHLQAPPPPYFQRTMKLLGLKMPKKPREG